MGEELAEIIRTEIRRDGPIPFSRWMELCLYHPVHGYYMKTGKKTGAGQDADFVTPPTLHPFFSRCVAQEMVATWERLGRPPTFKVCEWGGGEGDLARVCLHELDRLRPDFARILRWVHIERSPPHRTAQRQVADDRVTWMTDAEVQTGWGKSSTPNHRPRDPAQFTILCEVLDAQPFTLYEVRDDGWKEVFVAMDADRFVEAFLDPAPQLQPESHILDNEVRRLYEMSPLMPPNGQRLAYLLDAMYLLEKAWDATVGTVLVADYMDWPDRLYRGDHKDGTVRAYRGHQHVEPLENPGEHDITITLDVRQVAARCGGSWPFGPQEPLETLEQFLLRHGILDALNAIDRNTVEGASSYLRLRQLLLPTGMGAAFKVQRFERQPRTAATTE